MMQIEKATSTTEVKITRFRCPGCHAELSTKWDAERCLEKHGGIDITGGEPGDEIKIDDGFYSSEQGQFAPSWFPAIRVRKIVANDVPGCRYLFERPDGTRNYAAHRSVLGLRKFPQGLSRPNPAGQAGKER